MVVVVVVEVISQITKSLDQKRIKKKLKNYKDDCVPFGAAVS